MTFNTTQRADLISLLWDFLKRDREHRDRKQTGWGTKTEDGLLTSIENIVNNRPGVDADKLFDAYWNSELSSGVKASARYHAALYGTKNYDTIKSVVHQAFVAGTKAVPR